MFCVGVKSRAQFPSLGAGRNGKLHSGLFLLHFCMGFILLPLTVTRI